MPKLTVEGFGDFDIPDDKRLILALEQDAGIDVLHGEFGSLYNPETLVTNSLE